VVILFDQFVVKWQNVARGIPPQATRGSHGAPQRAVSAA
jgi:hypothetical protein